MNPAREKVLVLGEGVSAFLAVIRSLGRRGLEVHVAWCQDDSPALVSRYVKRHHRLPVYDAESDWSVPFLALLQRERFALVLPTNEQSIRALHARRAELEPHARLYLPDNDTFDVVFDKVKCCHLAEELGLRVPAHRTVKSLEEMQEAASTWGYPLVLKPVSSYDPSAPLARRDVLKAYDADELRRQAARLLDETGVQVQENFVGRGVGVELLVDQGEVLLAFQHQRVHQPLRGGASSYRKSVPLTPELLEASRKFVAALDYSGVIMLEFLLNDQGDWRFVEANARFWGSLPLAIAAGADFPFALYRYLIHGDRRFSQAYRSELYCRNVLSDMLWLRNNLRADRRDPTLATVSLASVLAEVTHVLTGRERFDTLTLDDPLPALAEVWKYARRLYRRLANAARERLASLPGVRHWHATRAQAALARARCVVFLCWGNICRSPFAAEYARRVWPEHLEITSRGLHHQQRRTSPPTAIDAARAYDVDLESHRSGLLTDEEVAQADMIVCFDERIRRELLSRHPGARGKTYRFGTLASSGPVSVADPFGRDPRAFQHAYRCIKQILDAASAAVGTAEDVEPRRREAIARDVAP